MGYKFQPKTGLIGTQYFFCMYVLLLLLHCTTFYMMSLLSPQTSGGQATLAAGMFERSILIAGLSLKGVGQLAGSVLLTILSKYALISCSTTHPIGMLGMALSAAAMLLKPTVCTLAYLLSLACSQLYLI